MLHDNLLPCVGHSHIIAHRVVLLLLLEIRRKRWQLGLYQLILLVRVVSDLMMETFLVNVSCELGDIRTHLLNGKHFGTTIQ